MDDLCIRANCKNKAQIHSTYGAMPCKECQEKDRQIRLNRGPEFAVLSKANRIQGERDKHEKDILPPRIGKENKPNPDFVRAYPELRSQYFSVDELNKL